MKDFEDDYTEDVPFSAYFPYYQLMGYEQLRTYFTWRTKIRKGRIENTSLSYAFVYIYELLNNIGTADPEGGLVKLMSFWKAFSVFDRTIDKYLIKWIKDYHIYYRLSKPFREFLIENELQNRYPDVMRYEPDTQAHFEQLCGISKYPVTKSVFYSDETSKIIIDCFNFIVGRLKKILADAGISFHDLLFQTSRHPSVWTPFGEALFYPVMKQRDKKIVSSENEVYVCSQNKWTLTAVTAKESGKQLVGYLFKQMEAVLRKAKNYKYKLSANLNTIPPEVLQQLCAAGISIEKEVTAAVLKFYEEENKTVVSVNQSALRRIRLEALDTQEKLIVPESDGPVSPVVLPEPPSAAAAAEKPPAPVHEPVLADGWTSLESALTETERQALLVALEAGDIKRFAFDCGMMPEVLADNINEKATDHIGDSILELDESMLIYDDYRENILKMVGR
jgi:hypothetical protein